MCPSRFDDYLHIAKASPRPAKFFAREIERERESPTIFS
jgi:hypothetical protein